MIIVGDVREKLRELPDGAAHMCVTSPPYWSLRDYGTPGQLGLEPTIAEYIANMVAVFREVRRVLRDDGTLWLNMGDGYASNWPAPNGRRNIVGNPMSNGKRETRPPRMPDGLKDKDLIGQPWRLAFALQADGWYLRSDIIWAKPNPMPESVTDRPTRAHEYLFLMAKSERYYYDSDAIRENAAYGFSETSGDGYVSAGNNGRGSRTVTPGDGGTRNKRDVWTIATEPYPDAHFATYPTALVRPCILAGTSERGCCAQCGAPWVREVERGENGGWDAKYAAEDNDWSTRRGGIRGRRVDGADNPAQRRTTGWRPSCDCYTYKCQSCDTAYRYGTDCMPPVPTDVRGEGQQRTTTEILQSSLFAEMDSSPSEGHQGVRHEPEGVQAAIPPSASDGIEGRLCNGAPLGDGGTSGAQPDGDRGSSPSQRATGGQSPGESASDVQNRTRQAGDHAIRVSMPEMPPYLSDEGKCPACAGVVDWVGPEIRPAVVLDCFAGSGTTGQVAHEEGREFIGIELNPEYAALAERRIEALQMQLAL